MLADALSRCRSEDMRAPEVFAALDFLEFKAMIKWPFKQFRDTLEGFDADQLKAEARWQMLNASLNGVKLAVLDIIFF